MTATPELAQITAWVREHAAVRVAHKNDGEILEGLEAAAQLRRMSDALLARYAGEVERRTGPGKPKGGLARAQGYGNANTFVSKVTGGSGGEARRLIQAGRTMAPVESAPDGTVPEGAKPRHGAIETGLVSGELSLESASGLITTTATSHGARTVTGWSI